MSISTALHSLLGLKKHTTMANTPSPEQLPHKELFTLRRKEFWENPQSQADLDAYRRRDNAHEYTVL